MRNRGYRRIGPSFPSAPMSIAAPANEVKFDHLYVYNVSNYQDGATPWNYGNTGLNVGSGANGQANPAIVLVASFVFDNAGVGSSPDIMWGSQHFTIFGPYANGVVGNTYLCGLTNPSLGQQTLTATWTGSSQLAILAMSVVGADQTGSTTTFRAIPTPQTATNSSPSITVSGAAASEMCIAGFESSENSGTFGNNGTPNNLGFKYGGWHSMAAAYSKAGESTTLTQPLGKSEQWVAVGMAIKAA